MIVAVDTSALSRLLVEEDESPSLRSYLAESAGENVFCISSLAAVELRRLAIRLDLAEDRAAAVIAPFTVVRLSEAVLQLAGRLPSPYLRTLDALHLATALTVEAGALVTYDLRQTEAARHEGLRVDAPAAD